MSTGTIKKLELKISCRDLSYGLNSTQVILFTKDPKTKKWELTPYRTEIIASSLNPKYVASIVVDHSHEELQQFRFACINVIKPNNSDWKAQKVIGYCESDLGSIVDSRKVKEKLCLDSQYHGTIIIVAEYVNESRRNVNLQIQAHNIVKTGFFSKLTTPQAFLLLSRANEDDETYSPVYKSQPISLSSMNSSWDEFDVMESTLCNGDLDRPLLLEIKEVKVDRSGEHVLLGKCTVSLREFVGEGTRSFPLKLAKGNVHHSKESSRLTIRLCSRDIPTVEDYIDGGTQINLVIAIDFTESNHDPKLQDSLHYIGDKNKENDYQQAIRSVGTILEKYDSDKKIPVYGFGGKFNGTLSHCHPLNNNFDDPEVDGIDGVMKVYRQTINNVELSGPTIFSRIINDTAKKIRAEVKAKKDVYYILLIITDGVITDMDTTIRAIVSARKLPLSIVIVGVGDADFTSMDILDADDDPLTMQSDLSNDAPVIEGKDIVQFVPMRDFQTGVSRDYFLQKAVMEEIPGQILSYMKDNNKQPKAQSLI